MNEPLHIIIAGSRGRIIRLPLSRGKLWTGLALGAVVLTTLTVSSLFSMSLFRENRVASLQLDELREQLRTSAAVLDEMRRESEQQQLRLSLKVAKLELSNVQQAVAFKEEKENILSTAVNELTERSELIEKMIDSIGIELPEIARNDTSNSGGVFIAHPADSRGTLINRADRYLKAIRFLPLGSPVDGQITSEFGQRYDPINGKSAFHTGIDFRAKTGDSIYATADGVVQKAFYNGGHGNYVLIDHDNGYATAFSHMKKFLVRPGDKVRRGQLIGYVGNSGRSTGSHLHYEVLLDGEPIDPDTFMKVAGASEVAGPTAEKR